LKACLSEWHWTPSETIAPFANNGNADSIAANIIIRLPQKLAHLLHEGQTLLLRNITHF
jgi:hypothetical protein